MHVVHWGILGTARIAESQFIPAIRDVIDSKITAVASRDATRASAFATRNAIPTAYDNYEALLADPQIDAVYIPLPNHEHARFAILAAKYGKHVLCEKPLALHAQEVKEMRDAATAQGTLMMEAFMYPFHPQWERVRDIIEKGEIGEIRIISSSFSFPLNNDQDIRMNRSYGGGALYDVGTYCVHVSRMLMQDEPFQVTALAHFDEKHGIDLTLSGILDFSGGRQAHFDCSFEAIDRQHVDIIGSLGSIAITHPFRPDKGKAELIIQTDSHTRVEAVSTINQYTKELEFFCHCVKTNYVPNYLMEQSLAHAKVLDTLYQTARI